MCVALLKIFPCSIASSPSSRSSTSTISWGLRRPSRCRCARELKEGTFKRDLFRVTLHEQERREREERRRKLLDRVASRTGGPSGAAAGSAPSTRPESIEALYRDLLASKTTCGQGEARRETGEEGETRLREGDCCALGGEESTGSLSRCSRPERVSGADAHGRFLQTTGFRADGKCFPFGGTSSPRMGKYFP